MIFLQLHSTTNAAVPRANEDQIKKAAALIKRIDLKDFSVYQFANPGKNFCFFHWWCMLQVYLY